MERRFRGPGVWEAHGTIILLESWDMAREQSEGTGSLAARTSVSLGLTQVSGAYSQVSRRGPNSAIVVHAWVGTPRGGVKRGAGRGPYTADVFPLATRQLWLTSVPGGRYPGLSGWEVLPGPPLGVRTVRLPSSAQRSLAGSQGPGCHSPASERLPRCLSFHLIACLRCRLSVSGLT